MATETKADLKKQIKSLSTFLLLSREAETQAKDKAIEAMEKVQLERDLREAAEGAITMLKAQLAAKEAYIEGLLVMVGIDKGLLEMGVGYQGAFLRGKSNE